MKGQYIGADGRTYRWHNEGHKEVMRGGMVHQVRFKSWCRKDAEWQGEWIHPEDWPAAKAALDELIEEEAGEWVEWTSDKFDYRAKSDGSVVEWATRHTNPKDWTSWDCPDIAAAYCKGREVALEEGIKRGERIREAEATKLQEAISALELARELVEAVGDVKFDLLWQPKWQRIKAVAKALEGKL